jgi:hypothetical protein
MPTPTGVRDDVAWEKRHDARQRLDQSGNLENQIAHAGILAKLRIDPRLNTRRCGRYLTCSCDPRSGRAERVRRLTKEPW